MRSVLLMDDVDVPEWDFLSTETTSRAQMLKIEDIKCSFCNVIPSITQAPEF